MGSREWQRTEVGKLSNPRFTWLAVFELAQAIEVEQGEDRPPLVQVVNAKQTRIGDVEILPGQPTNEVIARVVELCKKSSGVHADALMTSVQFFPYHMNMVT